MLRNAFLSSLVCASLGAFTTQLSAQSEIVQIGAAVPGKSITARLVAPANAAGKGYVLVVTPHTDNSVALPPFLGQLKVDLSNILAIFSGTFPAGNAQVDQNFALPNTQSLIGLVLDGQFVDNGTDPASLSEDVVVTVLAGVGTSVFAQGAPTSGVGFDMNRVQNTTVGNPAQAGARKYESAPTYFVEPRGFTQGHFRTANTTDRYVGLYVHKGDRVQRDQRDGTFGSMALPTGRRFKVVRDTANPKDFLCLLIEDKTGAVTEIAGTRFTSLSTVTTPANAFNDNWGFSPDGKIACGMVTYGSGTNTSPRDAFILVRLDGTTWPRTSNRIAGEGTPVLNVSPPTSAAANLQFFTGMYTYMTKDSVCYGSNSGFFWVPLDGSRLSVAVNFPNSGTNVAPFWFHGSSFRVSDDGSTLALPRGHVQSSSSAAHDVYVLSGIDKAGNSLQIRNITGFRTNTPIERFWGANRTAGTTFLSDMSRDGEIIAFIGNNGGTASPNTLYVAPTSGALAGSLTTIGTFPTGTVYLASPYIAPNKSSVYVFAGSSTTRFDLYRVELNIARNAQQQITGITARRTTNLTNKGDINVRYTFVSENGLWYYFSRDFASSTTSNNHNLVAVQALSGSVRDISGKEFASGTTADLELSTSVLVPEFRAAPNTSGEIYFLAQPTRTANPTTFSDMNVYKWDMERGGSIQRVTSYTGTGSSTTAVKTLKNLQVLADGSVVFSVVTGTPSATNKEIVTYLSSASGSKPVGLGRFARGAYVVTGSVRVQGTNAYWVQSDNSIGNVNSRGYMAPLSDLTVGHPVLLTGLPKAAGSGYIVNMAVGSTNN